MTSVMGGQFAHDCQLLRASKLQSVTRDRIQLYQASIEGVSGQWLGRCEQNKWETDGQTGEHHSVREETQ